MAYADFVYEYAPGKVMLPEYGIADEESFKQIQEKIATKTSSWWEVFYPAQDKTSFLGIGRLSRPGDERSQQLQEYCHALMDFNHQLTADESFRLFTTVPGKYRSHVIERLYPERRQIQQRLEEESLQSEMAKCSGILSHQKYQIGALLETYAGSNVMQLYWHILNRLAILPAGPVAKLQKARDFPSWDDLSSVLRLVNPNDKDLRTLYNTIAEASAYVQDEAAIYVSYDQDLKADAIVDLPGKDICLEWPHSGYIRQLVDCYGLPEVEYPGDYVPQMSNIPFANRNWPLFEFDAQKHEPLNVFSHLLIDHNNINPNELLFDLVSKTDIMTGKHAADEQTGQSTQWMNRELKRLSSQTSTFTSTAINEIMNFVDLEIRNANRSSFIRRAEPKTNVICTSIREQMMKDKKYLNVDYWKDPKNVNASPIHLLVIKHDLLDVWKNVLQVWFETRFSTDDEFA